jgi:spermidine synthase
LSKLLGQFYERGLSMSSSIRQNADGSIALFIRDDLQFDSNDERIYHESLVLPGLAVIERRLQSSLRVLVIGGGDGLVARELLKSPQVASLDLVDYDPEILNFAKSEFIEINGGSLLNERVSIHIKDAWGFVDAALAIGTHYDLIVSDLTVPENSLEARFHSVDWYTKLSQLLSEKGVLAVNAVSPQATPQAYWSIFNSIAKGNLHPRPYHIILPSFAAQGFGDDWGFFLASKVAILSDELDEHLPLAQPRQFLQGSGHLLQLFEFPTEFFAYQASSLPALAGSSILLHYFQNAESLVATAGNNQSSFSLDTSSIVIPEPDNGKAILPPEISSALAKSIYLECEQTADQSQTAQMFLYGVLDLMPSLNREHTQEIIEDFLAEPESFLQAIDLPDLVSRLLRRASELPARLVEELELLQEKLRDWTGDSVSLLKLTERVITIIVLVVVVGNLLYPDAVYAKPGHHPAAANHAAHNGHNGRNGRNGRNGGGRVGGVYGGRTYWNGTTWTNPRPINNNYTRTIINKKEITPKINNINEAVPGFGPDGVKILPNQVSSSEYLDSRGTVYPAKRFRIDLSYLDTTPKAEVLGKTIERVTASEAIESYAAYRLGPGADILPTGHVVMPLTNESYLLITKEAMHLMDQRTGTSTMPLGNDVALTNALAAEINRQQLEPNLNESSKHYLNAAEKIMASIEATTESNNNSLADDRTELFPSVWIAAQGKYLSLKRDNGALVCLKANDWYSDEGITALTEPYPLIAKGHIVSYLTRIIRDAEATNNRILRDKADANAHIAVLSEELSNYKSSNDTQVKFGSRNVDRAEAIRLTELAIKRTAHQIASLDRYMEQLPEQIEFAKVALTNLSNGTAQA